MQHLDEGTIHAWLDGQLPRDEAAAVEAHVAECRPCADAVAEARGLIAASSRILTALDAAPRDVAPKPMVSESAVPEGVLSLRREAPPNVIATPAQAPAPGKRVPRRWFTAPTLAAAAAAVLAVGMFSLYQRDGVPLAADRLERAAASTDSAPIASPAVATAPASPQSLGRATPANEVQPRPVPAGAAGQGLRQEADRPVEAAKRMAFTDSATREERRKVADNQAAADVSKPKELASIRVPPETSTVTVLRGTSVAAASAVQAEVGKMNSARADVANAGSVQGRVTDANKTPIVGAMVQIAGTNTAVTTGAQGEYSLGGVPAGERQLTVRRIGYQEIKRDVAVVQGQTVSADIVLAPAMLALDQVVVTGTAASERKRATSSSVPPPSATNAPARGATPAPQPPTLQQQAQATAAGCYEWTVTPTGVQARTRFLQVPRRLALDTVVTPSSNDGIWYLARDLARTAVLPNGSWRPTDGGIEVQWVVGAKTSTVRLTGSANGVMRGNIEEIDRAAGTGESGSVISVRRSCDGT
jgi:anti-sigma factor RsiW